MANTPRDLTQALLETAEGMHRVGMVSDDTYQKITVRHLGSAAPLTAAPISPEGNPQRAGAGASEPGRHNDRSA